MKEWIDLRKKTAIFVGACLLRESNFEIGGKGGAFVFWRHRQDGCFFADTGTLYTLFSGGEGGVFVFWQHRQDGCCSQTHVPWIRCSLRPEGRGAYIYSNVCTSWAAPSTTF